MDGVNMPDRNFGPLVDGLTLDAQLPGQRRRAARFLTGKGNNSGRGFLAHGRLCSASTPRRQVLLALVG